MKEGIYRDSIRVCACVREYELCWVLQNSTRERGRKERYLDRHVAGR
jgi:hypothetical protein